MNPAALGALALTPLLPQSAPSFDPVTTPSRIAWGDFDADGLTDALVLPLGGLPVLLQSLGDGAFLDRSELLVGCELGPVAASAWSDFDADGLPDLLVVDERGVARLLQNGGGAPFLDVTDATGLAGTDGVLGVEWHDYDGDEREDLVVHGLGGVRILHNAGGVFVGAELPAAVGALAWTPLSDGVAADPSVEESGRAPGTSAGSVGSRASGSAPGSGVPGAGAAGSFATTPGAVGPGGVNLAAGLCVPSLADMAPGGACLSASSDPLLGALYPLSEDLFVDAQGFVGMGTTMPLGPLHIASVTPTDVKAAGLVSEELVLDAADAVLGIYSTAGGSWGSAIVMAEVDGDGTLVDKWSFVRGTPTQDSRLKITHGSNPQYWVNPTVMTLEPEGNVGIGIEDPLFPLHVAGSGTAVWIDSDTVYSLIVNNDDGLAAFFDGATSVGTLGPFGPLVKVDARVEPSNDSGLLQLFNAGGDPVSTFGVDSVGGGYMRISRANDGGEAALLDTNGDGEAYLRLRNGLGGSTVLLHGADSTDAGYLRLSDANGVQRILLDGNSGGKGRVICDVLEITGGADLVESFNTRESVEPGTVLVIDEANPGALCVATSAYDTKVAGIVSGAGGVDAGLSLGQDSLSGDTPVALNGRVYVKATTEGGAIRAGDRLTTSSTPGHAMRVADAGRADGAVLGKAMTTLDEGTGLVLVLVNLQ